MINKLCQIIVNEGIDYLEDYKGNVLQDTIKPLNELVFNCEILQFNSQEDCDNLRNLVSIRNESLQGELTLNIRNNLFQRLKQLPGLENLQ